MNEREIPSLSKKESGDASEADPITFYAELNIDKLALESGEYQFSIGRSPQDEAPGISQHILVYPYAGISRKHLVFAIGKVQEAYVLRVTDVSTNGTMFNGEALEREVPRAIQLQPSQTIRLLLGNRNKWPVLGFFREKVTAEYKMTVEIKEKEIVIGFTMVKEAH